MSSCVQTGNGTPHDKYDIRGIAHVRTNRKDDIFMQRRLMQNFTYILEWGRGTCTLTKHTRRWTYSALRYFLFIFSSYFVCLSNTIMIYFILFFLSLTWPMRSNKVLQDTRQTNKQTVSSIWTVVSQLKIDRISWILEPAAGKITAWMSWVVFGCPPDATVLWFFFKKSLGPINPHTP